MDPRNKRSRALPSMVRKSHQLQLILKEHEEAKQTKRKRKKKKKKKLENGNNYLHHSPKKKDSDIETPTLKEEHHKPVFLCGILHEIWVESDNKLAIFFLAVQLLCGMIILLASALDFYSVGISIAYQVFGLVIPVIASMLFNCIAGGVIGICRKGKKKKSVVQFSVSAFFSFLACVTLLVSIYPQYKTFAKASASAQRMAAFTVVLFSANFVYTLITCCNAKIKANGDDGLKIYARKDGFGHERTLNGGQRRSSFFNLDSNDDQFSLRQWKLGQSQKSPDSRRTTASLTTSPNKNKASARGQRRFSQEERAAMHAVLASQRLSRKGSSSLQLQEGCTYRRPSGGGERRRSRRKSMSHGMPALEVGPGLETQNHGGAFPRTTLLDGTPDEEKRHNQNWSSIRANWKHATSHEERVVAVLQHLRHHKANTERQEVDVVRQKQRQLSASMLTAAKTQSANSNQARRHSIAAANDVDINANNRRLSATMIHASKTQPPQSQAKNQKKHHTAIFSPQQRKKKTPNLLGSPLKSIQSKKLHVHAQKRLVTHQRRGSSHRALPK